MHRTWIGEGLKGLKKYFFRIRVIFFVTVKILKYYCALLIILIPTINAACWRFYRKDISLRLKKTYLFFFYLYFIATTFYDVYNHIFATHSSFINVILQRDYVRFKKLFNILLSSFQTVSCSDNSLHTILSTPVKSSDSLDRIFLFLLMNWTQIIIINVYGKIQKKITFYIYA